MTLLDSIRGMSTLQLSACEAVLERLSFRDASVDPLAIVAEIRRLRPSQLRRLIRKPVPGTPIPVDADDIDTCGREYQLLAILGLPEEEAARQLAREKDEVRLLVASEGISLEEAWARVIAPTRTRPSAPGDDDADQTSFGSRLRRVRSRLHRKEVSA